MKTLARLSFSLMVVSLASFNSFSQLGNMKIEKPKGKPKIESPVEIKTDGKTGLPTVETEVTQVGGLFFNVPNDMQEIRYLEGTIDELKLLEAELAKPSVDYPALKKMYSSIDVRLSNDKKSNPNILTKKFDERYAPSKERAEREYALYEQVAEYDSYFSRYQVNGEYREPKFGGTVTRSYGVEVPKCYCREEDDAKTYQEYFDAKVKYDELVKGLAGYSNERTTRLFSDMSACVENGNKYALWASTTYVDAQLKFHTEEVKKTNPKSVIESCDYLLEGLEWLEKDHSLALIPAVRESIAQAKTKVAPVKAESELYISSGEYQKYLDAEEEKELLKVILPKPAMRNESIEQKAMNYLKTVEGQSYMDAYGVGKVASTYKGVITSASMLVQTNDYGIPSYKFYPVTVSFKNEAGECYMVDVRVRYPYEGGGTYSATATEFSADIPVRMSCANVSK